MGAIGLIFMRDINNTCTMVIAKINVRVEISSC